MTQTRHLARGALLPALAIAVALAACTPTDSADAPLTDLPLLTLGEPSLEIGVVEGDEAYTFGSVDWVLRLADGTVAVSDGANTRISLYDGSGSFVRSWGTRGQGPGEFRTLSRIYRHGRDSLMAADNATSRLSVFGLDGGYARQVDGSALSADSTFRLDSWLHGRFWMDGALRATERAQVRAALDRLPPPRESPGYRRALVAADNALWIRDASGARWILTDPSGSPVSAVDVPAGFTPMDVAGDEVLGQWIGPADVSFVRAYPLVATGETVPVPEWLRVPPQAVAAEAGPTDEEFSELMRQSIRGMAMAQEIHYSRSFTYTTDVAALDFNAPEGLGVSFTHAHPRGWAAVFTHPTADRICGLAYGAGVPPGWQAGGIVCGPPSTPPAPPGA